jgi:pyrroloquinoline quinone (PQQ) biosynthesis protein C/mannose-6-phosphate isomerase-like protein (cupin superfamily)
MTVTISDKVSINNGSADPLGGAIKRADDSVPPSSRAAHVLYQDPRRRTKGGGGRVGEITPEAALAQLHTAQGEHPFWSNRLFKACSAGTLTKDDFKFIFSQYYLYSKNFTRYLAALMANCDSDYHRSRLSENLWEEGGGAAPEKRHAEIFRRFLVDGLEIDVSNIDFIDSTRFFVREYLDFCMHSHPTAGSAFLSLGTEGIVARMYGILLEGLIHAGIAEEHTAFFRLHMECDDEHAETLEKMMLSFANTPDWYNTCYRSMVYALSLRERFFDKLYECLEIRRLRPIIDNIQNRESLVPDLPSPKEIHYRVGDAAPALYSNVNERLNIDFNVERVPFKTDVFDSRILRIAPHKNNEKHKHPHESVFYVIKGQGKVHVNEAEIEVKAGDMAFVPRWAMHQSFNTGDEELLILALTDFGLTERAFLGNHLKTTRMKGTQAER